MCPIERRRAAWARLATDLPAATLDAMIETVKLEDLPALAGRILAGSVRGRIVVDVAA
jgi:acrylyl-CoA reductase (NADPH)